MSTAVVLFVVQGLMSATEDGTPWFSPQTFSADEGCRWQPADVRGLRMNAYFIAGPQEGQDRESWIAELRTYRTAVREGTGSRVLDMTFDGVRAWTRMAAPLAKALELKPGDTLEVAVEAQWVEGNDTLCVAFDLHDRGNDATTGWTGVQATLPIGKESGWHSPKTSVTVPEFDVKRQWIQPIVGMDATKDATPGHVRIRSVRMTLDDAARMQALEKILAQQPTGGLDLGIYRRKDLAWASRAFTCHFTFMYDRSFYDPDTGRYKLDAFLDDGDREFGGYDILVLWQGYPRLGVDERNQFDMYRDMPGGLDGLRELITKAHERGVKVFVDYSPWDRGTRREPVSDEESLAQLVAAIAADGVFLDTMTGGAATLRARLDTARRGVVLAPEGHPAIEQLGICSASWAQGLTDPAPPGLLHLKWLEPRHMQHQIRRWDSSHRAEIETAFFNGSGMLIWENVFGTFNPWPIEERRLWKRAVGILRCYADQFTSDSWDPFYPTVAQKLFANRWPGDDVTVFTLLNYGDPLKDAPLVEVPSTVNAKYYDAWNGTPLRVESRDGRTRVIGSVERLGCILEVVGERDCDTVSLLMKRQNALAHEVLPIDVRGRALSVVAPRLVTPARPVLSGSPPAGMVSVTGATVRMRISHMRRECGCYPDPGTPTERWRDFLWGSPFDATLHHDYSVEVKPFFIDEAEVSNADFNRFLEAAHYRPKHPEGFLRHWPMAGDPPVPTMPDAIADLPVVNLSLDDARAYARWAGKRLPTEPEWQLACQGTDARKWPWGAEPAPAKCNSTGVAMPVRSLPEGRSPCGCYHMAGNVWEWTESERDDGHTRFAVIRGGSYFNAQGSIWYVQGGPQPCDSHAKFLLMGPSLDRCATVGFRCVIDGTAHDSRP